MRTFGVVLSKPNSVQAGLSFRIHQLIENSGSKIVAMGYGIPEESFLVEHIKPHAKMTPEEKTAFVQWFRENESVQYLIYGDLTVVGRMKRELRLELFRDQQRTPDMRMRNFLHTSDEKDGISEFMKWMDNFSQILMPVDIEQISRDSVVEFSHMFD